MIESVSFAIDRPKGEDEIPAALAGDLANVITAQSGVAGVRIDTQSGIVEIEYDPDFVAPEKLRSYLTDAGYGVAEATGSS